MRFNEHKLIFIAHLQKANIFIAHVQKAKDHDSGIGVERGHNKEI
jgi:hypothetical protein